MDCHILIVDDEPKNLVMLEELFQFQGARVSSATDGRMALEKVAQSPPDLVLLDVSMPGLDGYEVCRRLKADEKTQRIPVIMVTGLRGLNDKIKGLEAGADDFLSKPVNAAELITRSQNLLRVKELDHQLENAYRRMAEISAYTNTLLGKFDPFQFDIQENLARLMDFLLRSEADQADRPQRLLLLSAEAGSLWVGWRYYRQGGEMKAVPLSGGAEDQAMEAVFGGQGRMALNLQGLAPDQRPGRGLWESLGEEPPARNIVGYRSESVAVLALDFGRRVGEYDSQVLSSLVTTIHFFLKTISSQIQEVDNAFLYTIGTLARAAELHDEDTGDHIIRVGLYAEAMAQALGQPEEWIKVLGYSAQMHDVGKMHLHPDTLRKPGPLTAQEWEEVKLHTIYGARIIGDHPRLAMAREVALTHHEHWDGSGYPHGLAGQDIPISGRIVMMADVYDALRSVRPYKSSFNHDTAVAIIHKGDDRLKSGWFDPRVLQAFLDIHREIADIFNRTEQ